jgi:hypothetical protein
MGSGSLKGCNVCDFGGVHFGETVKYPLYARYTSLTDERRLRRPNGCANSNVMWNLENITTPQPRDRTYEEYISQGTEVLEGVLEANVNGVHEPWILHQLSYAHLIHPTKDAMHCGHNTIRDSIKLLKPNQSKPYFVNRTKRPAVITSCRQGSIFSFITRENNPTWPWIMSKESCKTHDDRFNHVIGDGTTLNYD